MLEDQKFILGQIVERVREHAPQAVVIAGDVYDKPVPGVDAVRVFDDFLTELFRENVSVLLIGGNHDAPERIGFASRLLSERRVYLRGLYEGEVEKVTFTDAFGKVHFYLLPFVRPSAVRFFFEKVETYDDAVSAVLGALDIDWSERNVLVAHQFFASGEADPERSDSEVVSVGGLDRVDASRLAPFDYVALGHLHGPQKVGREEARYAGSPLKYSFSECRHAKSLVLVELREKGGADVSLVPLTPLRDVRKLKGPIGKLMSPEVARSGNCEDYLGVTLTDEEEILDPMDKLKSVYPNVLAIGYDNSRTRASGEIPGWEDGGAERVTPFALFGEFFLGQNGRPMTAEQAEIARKELGPDEFSEGGLRA